MKKQSEIPGSIHGMCNDELKTLITRLESAHETKLARKLQAHLNSRPLPKDRTYKVQSDGSSFNKFLPKEHEWIAGKDAWACGNDSRARERSKL